MARRFDAQNHGSHGGFPATRGTHQEHLDEGKESGICMCEEIMRTFFFILRIVRTGLHAWRIDVNVYMEEVVVQAHSDYSVQRFIFVHSNILSEQPR